MPKLKSALHYAKKVSGHVGYHGTRLLGSRPTLTVRLNWNLGDEIMAIPLLGAIREKFPEAKICLWAKHPDLFVHNPHVDEFVRGLPGPLGKVLDIRGEDRTVSRVRFWERRLGLRVRERQPRIYFSKAEAGIIHSHRQRTPHALRVAVCSWSRWESKRWDAGNFRAVIGRLAQAGPVHVLEMGRGCPAIGLGQNCIDRTDIREAALLLASCDVFVGNDSGLMHLAAAAGSRAIGLFGPVDPRTLLEDYVGIQAVESPADCRGCWTAHRMPRPDACPLGKPICMDAITTDAVYQTIRKTLDAPKHAS